MKQPLPRQAVVLLVLLGTGSFAASALATHCYRSRTTVLPPLDPAATPDSDRFAAPAQSDSALRFESDALDFPVLAEPISVTFPVLVHFGSTPRLSTLPPAAESDTIRRLTASRSALIRQAWVQGFTLIQCSPLDLVLFDPSLRQRFYLPASSSLSGYVLAAPRQPPLVLPDTTSLRDLDAAMRRYQATWRARRPGAA
jgi:hypothetical protein